MDEGIGLSEALLMRTCCSSSNMTIGFGRYEPFDDFDLSQGQWAGHGFGIMMIDYVSEDG